MPVERVVAALDLSSLVVVAVALVSLLVSYRRWVLIVVSTHSYRRCVRIVAVYVSVGGRLAIPGSEHFVVVQPFRPS